MVDLRHSRRGHAKSPATNNHKQQGFTIVELMMATIVFSVIMLVAAGAVVRFTSNFQRGLTATTTQNTARSVIDSISQAVQFGSVDPPGPLTKDGYKGWCVGNTRYSYVIGKQLESQNSATTTKYALVEDPTTSGCYGTAQKVDGATTPVGQELLGAHMRLSKFSITNTADTSEVAIRIVYGDDDLLCSPSVPNSCQDTGGVMNPADLARDDLQCKGGKGSQYCAVSELRTTVQHRL